VSSAIAGNADQRWSIVQEPSGTGEWPPPPPSTGGPEPADPRDRIRWLPGQRRTASWQAAYTTACLYAALASKPPAAQAAWEEWVVVSLKRAVNNPHSEMERASDWISRDPDFSALRSSRAPLCAFERFLAEQGRMDYDGDDDADTASVVSILDSAPGA
jgi:hypothetical protein